MNEKLTTPQIVSALIYLFVMILSLFVITSLLLKLTGHSPTSEQILVSSLIVLLTGYGGVFKKYVDIRIDHLEEKMDLKFDHVGNRIDTLEKQMDHRFSALEKQMEYRFSRIEKKLGIV